MVLVQVFIVGTNLIYLVLSIFFYELTLHFFYSVIGIAEMFAEEGYDLILGFRENVTAAEKFKTQLLQKYKSQNVKRSFFNT